jgi:hypothetical protein
MTQEKELKPQVGGLALHRSDRVCVRSGLVHPSVRTQNVALVISVVVLLIANIILNSGLTIFSRTS